MTKKRILVDSTIGCDIFAYSKEDVEILQAELARIRRGENLRMTTQGPSETRFSPEGFEYSIAKIFALGGQEIGEVIYSLCD